MFVSSLYQTPSLLDDYSITASTFQKGGLGQFYYHLARTMFKRGYTELDRLSVESFIANSSAKGKKAYQKYGGYDTIEDFIDSVSPQNIDQYYADLLKCNALNKMYVFGIDIEKKWDLLRSKSYKELQEYMETIAIEAFSAGDADEDKIEDLKYGMRELLAEINQPTYKGLPVSSNCLNSVINGLKLGDITLLAGMSGVGKTFLTIGLLLPVIIRQNIPILIMCNEEDAKKWRWSIIVWIANNIVKNKEGYDLYIEKQRMFAGGLIPKENEILEKSIEWYEQHLEDNIINFVNFNSFSTDKAIRLIRKYSTQKSIKYYLLDTFKLDNDVNSGDNYKTEQAWLQLQQNVVKLYNVIKSSAKNVHVWMTYQLGKTPRKYLDQSSLGMSKNVADVASTVILARKVYEREKDGEKGLKIKDGYGNTRHLSSSKDYMVLFIDKNRSGSTSSQIVLETDKGKNIIRDVGFTTIMEDF